MRRAFTSELEGTQLTLAQAKTLLRLRRCEGARQVELAEYLEIRPITLTRLVDQLQAEGLVERRADPQDRRAFQLYLTEAAQPVVEQIVAAVTRLQIRALEGVTPDAVAGFSAVLESMRENLGSRVADLKDGADQ
ncbi:MAG: MarR family transcriptional regulator [Xanthomonadales bacterium]|nr:MarR family transcriptional regulator [Xanthomonadales bacterium]MCB1634704.1 MarR family transcriptional regulator [Xanthomonadales bacterium]